MRQSDRIFLDHFGLTSYDETQDTLVCEVDLRDCPDLVLKIFGAYLEHVRAELRRNPAKAYEINQKNFCTFEEYQELFDYDFFAPYEYRNVRQQKQIHRLEYEGYQVDPPQMTTPPVAMDYLKIPHNQQALDSFRKNNQNTVDDYINIVLVSKIPFTAFFFGTEKNLATC